MPESPAHRPDEFHVGVLLTVTADVFLCPRKGPDDNGIGELNRMLKCMTGEAPYTHQLGRFASECKPWLIRQHPWLDGPAMRAELKALAECLDAAEDMSDAGRERLAYGWLEKVAAKFGAYHRVERIPMDDHDRIDPVEELIGMVGPGRVVAIETPGEE